MKGIEMNDSNFDPVSPISDKERRLRWGTDMTIDDRLQSAIVWSLRDRRWHFYPNLLVFSECEESCYGVARLNAALDGLVGDELCCLRGRADRAFYKRRRPWPWWRGRLSELSNVERKVAARVELYCLGFGTVYTHQDCFGKMLEQASDECDMWCPSGQPHVCRGRGSHRPADRRAA
jgi:hypothetical protein